MIQRIQTIYLLIITVLGVATLFMPIFFISMSNVDFCDIYVLNVLDLLRNNIAGTKVILPKIVALVAMLIPIMSFITIFIFKNRKLQIKLSFIVLFAILLFCLFFSFWVVDIYNNFSIKISSNIRFYILLSLNLVSFIFSILSIRAIRKDEKLVKSLDRIR